MVPGTEMAVAMPVGRTLSPSKRGDYKSEIESRNACRRDDSRGAQVEANSSKSSSAYGGDFARCADQFRERPPANFARLVAQDRRGLGYARRALFARRK